MRKIFTYLLMVTAMLVPATAGAVAITSISPSLSQDYNPSTDYIVLTPATFNKNSSISLTSVAVSYGSVSEQKLTDVKSSWNNLINGTEGFFYWPTDTKYELYVKVPIAEIQASGATSFTVTVTGWKIDRVNMTTTVSGINIDSAGVVSFTYNISDSGNGGGGDDGGDDNGDDDGDDSDVEYATEFAWNTPMVMGNGTVFTIPQGGANGPVYVKTNSNTNLTSGSSNFLWTDQTCTTGVVWDEVISADEGNVYQKVELNMEWIPFYVKYSGKPVTFTFVQGTYDHNEGNDNPVVTPPTGAIELPWDTEVIPGTRGDKVYYFYGKGGFAQLVTNDAVNDLTMTNPEFLVKNNSENISVTPIPLEDGYVYNLGELEDGALYTISFYCLQTKFSMKLEEVQESEIPEPDPEQIYTGNEVTLNALTPYYYVAGGDGTLKVQVIGTMGGETWTMPGIVYTSKEHDTLLEGVTTDSSTLTYEFAVSAGESYYFYYTSPNWIVTKITFEAQVVLPDYMDVLPADTFVNSDDEQAVYVYWSEKIESNVSGALTAKLTTPADGEVAVTVEIVSYNPEEGDEYVDNALKFDAAAAIAQYGAGEYTLLIPAELVKNATGAVNNDIEVTFNIEASLTESEIEPTVVVSPSLITVSWNDETIEIYDNYGEVAILTADGELAMTLKLNEGVAISDDGKTLVITIADDTLADGSYILGIKAETFIIGGNTYNADVDYEFTYESTGVNTITSAAEGSVIYNLQGMKVANPAKGGIYIINGKKVVVK